MFVIFTIINYIDWAFMITSKDNYNQPILSAASSFWNESYYIIVEKMLVLVWFSTYVKLHDMGSFAFETFEGCKVRYQDIEI